MFAALGTDQIELTGVGFTLASYVFMKSDQSNLDWLLKRYHTMHDLMRESPFFQWILQEGREEGLAQGKAEGRLTSARQLLREFVQRRFPDLLSLAQEQAESLQQPEVLEALVLKVLLAQSQAEAEEHLRHQPLEK